MSRADTFAIQPAWRMLVRDLGLREADVLRRAGLPQDLLGRENPRIEPEAYFRLWGAFEEELGDPCFAVVVANGVRAEGFDPLLFASLCSPDLVTALGRLSEYKRLCGPLRLHLRDDEDGLSMHVECVGCVEPMPESFAIFELLFPVALARLATRHHVVPWRVTAPELPEQRDAYLEAFGVPIARGDRYEVTFSPVDARRPFLTANQKMWSFFEPELQQQLAELEADATTRDRVKAALLELLPSGRASIDEVSSALGVTPRTLQRRLKQEQTRFSEVLSETRERLARHYLESSTMSGAEISFLLGYEDPNSFFRAFHQWTGETPEGARAAATG